MATSKVGISLSDQMLQLIDAECSRSGLTRSEFIRRAVESTFETLDEQAADQAYAESYLRDPEDPAVTEAVERLATEALADDPWK